MAIVGASQEEAGFTFSTLHICGAALDAVSGAAAGAGGARP